MGTEFIEKNTLAIRKELDEVLTKNLNMKTVFNNLGIVIIVDPEHEVGGSFCDNDGAVEITLSRNYDGQDPHDKFILAKELGHFFLHWGIDSSRTKSSDTLDAEAVIFASNFLMPRDLYRESLDVHTGDGFGVEVDKVALDFNVTVKAAINRGINLGYISWLRED